MSGPPSPHPEHEALRAYGLGKLPPGDAAAVERHVAACEACRQVLEATPEDDFVTLVRRLSRRDAPPPRLHAGYEILEEIGRGGMAVVYKARQAGVGRVVALKRVLAGAAAAPDELARFRREARLAAGLRHPNIVQVHDYGEQGGLPYLAMEYVDGGTLADLLAGAPLAPRESAALVRTLAEAVAYAHGEGVVHRDLKPANVLLATRLVGARSVNEGGVALADAAGSVPVPKIADFGLARSLDATLRTQTGALAGTPSYMAPEQTVGDPATALPAVDVYALGATLYECLTGRPPFRAATVMETLARVRTLDPVPPRSLQPKVPRDLETICVKCLEKDSARRYPGAGELADDLGRFLAGEPIRARPAGALERAVKWARRKPAAAALALAGCVVALAAITAAAWHQHVLREQVERANANEAEARRQRAQALANFREAHEALDAIFFRLEEDTLRVEEPRVRALRREISEATIRYYTGVLRDVRDGDPELRLSRALVQVYAARVHHLIEDHAAARREFEEASRLLEELTAEFPGNGEYRWQLAYCRYRQAAELLQLGLTGEAGARLREALALLAPPPGAAEQARASRLRGLAHCLLACSLALTADHDATAAHAAEAVGVLTRLSK